jgi:3-dehydroquinate synthetase
VSAPTARVVRVSIGGGNGAESAHGTASYNVVLGRGVLAQCMDTARRRRPGELPRDLVVVLADREAWRLHGARVGALGDAPRLELEAGEGAKTLTQLGEVLDFLASSRCSRRSCLVVFGGGSLGDVGGLAASLFKRGMDVLQAPTTLLAQVDASIGGKTAINLAAGKNLAGTFHQPCAVLADSEVLGTLPEVELRSGMGEVLKSALIGGEYELTRLEARARAAAGRDADALGEVAADAVGVKARVVAADPLERDRRRVLNLGHTFAHALEHAAGYGVLPHGEAVAAGIGLALAASARLGVLKDTELPARYAALARTLGVAASLHELCRRYAWKPDSAALLAGFAHDKKGSVGAPEFVLLRRVGELELGVPLAEPVLAELLVT